MGMYTIHIDKLWSLLFPPFWSSRNCRSNVILSVKWIWIWANVIHRTFGDLRRNANFGWSWKYICGRDPFVSMFDEMDRPTQQQTISLAVSDLIFTVNHTVTLYLKPPLGSTSSTGPGRCRHFSAIFVSLPSTVPSHRNWWRLRRWYPRDNDLAKPRQNSP